MKRDIGIKRGLSPIVTYGKLLHSEIGLRDTTYQTITTTDYPKITNGK